MRDKLTVPGRHWSHEIAPNDIAMLDTIKSGIEIHVTKAAQEFIIIGQLLNQARNVLPGDKEFGQWREEHTVIKSRQAAAAYMAVARKFSEHGLVPKVSYTVLKELTSASDEVVKEVEEKADAGEHVTQRDVQELKKEDASPPRAESEPDPTPPVEPEQDTPAPDEKWGIGPAKPNVTTPPPVADRPAGEYIMIALQQTDINLVVEALQAFDTEASHDLCNYIQAQED